jgi:hypothetical protein
MNSGVSHLFFFLFGGDDLETHLFQYVLRIIKEMRFGNFPIHNAH